MANNDLPDVDLEDETFNHVENTLLFSSFRTGTPVGSKNYAPLPSKDLSLISCLYQYTNPPPMGTGSVGPYVAESVLRAYKFNKKSPETRTEDFHGYLLNKAYWEDEQREYPFNEVTGNWHPGEAYQMFHAMRKEHKDDIKRIVDRVAESLGETNAHTLTKGRQTWCPFNRSSVPSPTAFQTALVWFKKNGMGEIISLADFIRACLEVLNKTEIFTSKTEFTVVMKKAYDKSKRMTVRVAKMKKKIKKVRIVGAELCQKHVLDLYRSFCSYIKHGERGKLRRRAIASPNIFLRAFLYVIEEFHLDLCKKLPGTTISIGGDEKKCKITGAFARTTQYADTQMFTATEDATKFNECVSPDGFAFMHAVLLEYGNPVIEDNMELMLKLCFFGNFILAIKKITVGEGHVCVNKEAKTYNRPAYTAENLHRFNNKTQSWLEESLPYLENGEMHASPGMLMGMHNAAATTWAYAAAGYRQPKGVQVQTLRSSDDSMTIFTAGDGATLLSAVRFHHNALKLLGVNLSPEKSIFIKGPIGEYTSWYIDSEFVAQYGTETSALRPRGVSPGEDFNTIAAETFNALRRLEVNPVGAQARLVIGICNVRKLWKINREERPELSTGLQFLADGGMNCWDSMNCHANEVVIRWHKCVTQVDFSYLHRCCNPNNPFLKDMEPEYTYNKDLGRMTFEEVQSPLTIFHYVRQANRTFRGKKAELATTSRKSAANAMKILENADPTIKIMAPQRNTSCLSFITEKFNSLSRLHERDMPPHLQAKALQAARILAGDFIESEGEEYSDEE